MSSVRCMMAAPRLRDGGLVVALLILAAGLEGTLKVWPVDWAIALRILAGATLGLLAAWLGLTLLLHLAARVLGGAGGYRGLLARMGLAAAPMLLASLASSALYVVLPGDWEPLHTLIGWIGMTGGWPGLLTCYALRGEGLAAGRAGAVVGVIYVIMLIGWLLPALWPGGFG